VNKSAIYLVVLVWDRDIKPSWSFPSYSGSPIRCVWYVHGK